jgi:hypothetical protein
VIVFLYVSEGLRDRVCAATDPRVARAYFDGLDERFECFDDRMSSYLFGSVQHDRKRKRRVLEQVACPAPAIVISECLVFRKLAELYPQ